MEEGKGKKKKDSRVKEVGTDILYPIRARLKESYGNYKSTSLPVYKLNANMSTGQITIR